VVADNSELAVSIDPCPSCETTTGVQRITNTPPTVQAWSCTKCGTDWAISVVNPLLRSAYLTELAATRGEVGRLRWTLRQIFALVDDAPRLTD
jgi:ribosomal protein L37AE/L43A